MPTNRTPINRRRRRLSLAQQDSLSIGGPGFRDDAERREAWAQHRDVLLAHCQGSRPRAWWDYEAPIALPSDPDQQSAALYAANLLAERERNTMVALWRERFDMAQGPNFVGFCTGDGWIDGDAGRAAHYRWAGIPRALIRKWTAERRRRERQIAKLQAGATAI
jgi:hypothetical protein